MMVPSATQLPIGKRCTFNACSRAEACALFKAWWETEGRPLRVAAYGAGSDFQAFAKAVPSLREKLVAVFDDSSAQGTLPLSDLRNINPDAIIIASLLGQERMRRKLDEVTFEGIVILPFASDNELGTVGLLAYDPQCDWSPSNQPGSLQSTASTNPTAAARPTVKPGTRTTAKVLLFHPPFSTANHRHKKTMPLGLLYIGSSLRKWLPHVDLRLHDAHINNTSWMDITRLIKETEFDILAISYWSAQADNAYLLSDYVRMVKPEVVIIHGGVHATLSPDEALSHSDYVIKGEGERAFCNLLAALLRGDAQPRILESDFIANLDELPFPAWDLLGDVTRYDHPMHVVGGRRFPIIGSRGCPFNCSFCSSPIFWKRRVRWRTSSNVVNEMDAAHTKYGVDKFHFWDDNFVLNTDYAHELAEELLRRGNVYTWCGLSRASDLIRAKRLLPLLKKAGCVGLEIGVESFADQVSETVQKGETVEETRRAADLLRRNGIAPLYTHMLFTPGETITSYRSKELFMNSLRCGVSSTFKSDSDLGQLTTPHSKTKFANDAASLGHVLWRGAFNSHHHRVNFIPHSLLNDIPRKVSSAMPDPLPYLTIIVQSVYDWPEQRMRDFVHLSPLLWEEIDGHESVLTLAEAIARRKQVPIDEAMPSVCLLVMFWARYEHVVSNYDVIPTHDRE